MISIIKQDIADKLTEIYPDGYTVYDEYMPQDFEKPSFLIVSTGQSYSKRMNNKYSGKVSFDVAYFSDKDATEVKKDCLDKQMSLLRAFSSMNAFHAQNMQANITDNILHVTFDVRYWEIKEETSTMMQTQQTNTYL